MRRATTLLTTTPAPRPQPPNTSMRAHLTQPRATPAPQHAHATTRAQQAAGGEIRLDHGTIVCDDHHDDLRTASRASRFIPPRFGEGPQQQHDHHDHVAADPAATTPITTHRGARPPPRSPTGASLNSGSADNLPVGAPSMGRTLLSSQTDPRRQRTEADTSSARHPPHRGSQSTLEPDLGSTFDPTRTVARAGTKDSTPGAL